MGSPETQQIEPRERIAQAACALVAQRGLEGATFRRVAEELGCTTGFISHYYSSKEALLEATLRVAVHQVVRTSDLLCPARSLEEWVDQIVHVMPREDSREFWRVLIVFQAASLTSERLSEVLATYFDAGKPELLHLLRDAAPPGAGEEAVRCARDAIWVLVDGFGTTATLNPSALRPDQLRSALRGAVRGLLHELDQEGAVS